jgi:hypothetical protein
MNIPGYSLTAHTLRLALAASAALAISVPVATSAAAKSPSEKCSEVLEKNFGATGVGDVNPQMGGSGRSVYADAKLGSGETIRVRCLFRKDGIHDIQVFAPTPLGSPNPGSRWGSADAYRVPPKPDDAPAAPPEATPAEPEQTPPEPEGPKRVKPNTDS